MPAEQASRRRTGRVSKPGRKKTASRQGKNKLEHFLGYVCLFALVFFCVLWGLSFAVKSYSPEISTSEIGVNEVFSLNLPEPAADIKPVDERLKLIQMEDDLPSVSIKADDTKKKKSSNYEEEYAEPAREAAPPVKQNLTLPMPKISEIKKQQEEKELQADFKNIPAKEVIPLQKRVITKVYLGNYASHEDAVKIQAELVRKIDAGIVPFIKPVNGYYIIQLGSFTDGEKADALADKIRAMGFYPKMSYEH